MWQNDELKNHLETSFTVQSQTAVVAEWNMNVPGNIFKMGNYRYRKNDSTSDYFKIPNFFDPLDESNHYTNATDSDVVIESGLETDTVTPLLFTYTKELEKLYYSLEDCFKPYRPRSGINKASFFNNKYFSHPNQDMYLRPRYYMPHRDDQFKYWRSYRTESLALEDGYVTIQSNSIPIPLTSDNSNKEYGISKYDNANGIYSIDDACPFVVYKESVPANRIICKVQTNIGDINLGPFKKDGEILNDPFYGQENATTPVRFTIQYLSEYNEWIDAYSFNEDSLRDDNTDIFNSDGYLSLQYGLEVPDAFKDNFILVGTSTSASSLPTNNVKGYAYLVKSTSSSLGILYIWNGSGYSQFTPKYSWKIGTDGVYENTQFVTDFTNPDYFIDSNVFGKIFREFVFIKGLRVVVETMNVPNVPFELIELSPRLVADMTNKTISFSTSKVLSDLGNSSIPVGNLLASTGSISIFDNDSSFNENNIWDGNEGSIIAKYFDKTIKFNIYEVIREVNDVNYYIPIKTLYTEGMPQTNAIDGNISFALRDFYFYFESVKAPEILITEASLSQAVAILLDHIGFSNYIFKRLSNEKDPIIPYFFVAPEQNVAEVLRQLAISTQSAMYFDEYNNFVVVSKNYLLDETDERPVDIVLYGSNNSSEVGINKNVYPNKLSNIIGISSQNKKIYNDGNITYTERYIQRSYGSIKQSQMVDQDKTFIYKPVLLWEVSGSAKTKTANNEMQSTYVLSALPLNSDLDNNPPSVVNNILINNTIDFGENVYWLGRYQGYFYAAGEIIRFDAVQYNIPGVGNEWITSGLEYQKYFSQLPFNGKMYPTGLVRIYAEPYYETINGNTVLKNGEVAQHGREQFGTTIQYHNAGLDSYWSSNDYVQGCDMQSELLYTTKIDPTLPAVTNGVAGLNKSKAEKSKRNGIIKNLFATSYATETDVPLLKTTQTGTIQSSALVFNGPIFEATEKSRDFVSYVWKELDRPFKCFGTRMRIIGRIESNGESNQTPVGSTTYFNITGIDPTKTVTLGGGSGGICLVNPTTNQGYYFEIAALTSSNLNKYLNTNSSGEATNNLDNILFYKVQRNSSTGRAVPVKLWGGIGNILVDSGEFTGQYRVVNEKNPTVYDLTIEYMDINSNRRVFYLYINYKLVQVVTDTSPIPITGNQVGLFVRGSTKIMFENIYALGQNYSQNSSFPTGIPISKVFGDDDGEINANESLSKYAMSGIIQKTYMKGIMPMCMPVYDIFYDEFGTIMREASYFKVKYDKAYPALYAKIAATFNRLKGYVISGFMAESYGAEFLVFNATDTTISLDETSGNYLRIQGITFTQDTTHTLTVDEYYKKRGNLSDPELKGNVLVTSPQRFIDEYDSIRVSRIQYGRNEFTLQGVYIQDQDTAEDILGWVIGKTSKPKKTIGMEIFSIPTLQLGDIINIDYKTADGVDVISDSSTRYVVYQIDYGKSVDGPIMSLYAVEV